MSGKTRIQCRKIQSSHGRIGSVMILGPKGIGKTETCKQNCKSFIELDNPFVDYQKLFKRSTYSNLRI